MKNLNTFSITYFSFAENVNAMVKKKCELTVK